MPATCFNCWMSSGIEQAIFVGTSLGGLVTMTVNAMAPSRIAASILNDIGPELSQAGLDRIMTYVGKDVRFDSWDRGGRGGAPTITAGFRPTLP